MPKSAKKNDPITLRDFTPYKEKKGEEYMNDNQKEHFKGLLFSWKKN